jgi:hypothetical protein
LLGSDIVSKRRKTDGESVKPAGTTVSPEKGKPFDPMAVEEPTTHRTPAAGMVPVGLPVSEREFAKLKKDALTSRKPRTRAQEDVHGDEGKEKDPGKR